MESFFVAAEPTDPTQTPARRKLFNFKTQEKANLLLSMIQKFTSEQTLAEEKENNIFFLNYRLLSRELDR